MCNISSKHGGALNTHNDFICRCIECVTSRKRKNSLGVAVRDDGVTGEGRVVGVPKFHS